MGKKILIIDDDGIVRDALKVFFMRSGYTVNAAADGLNGLALYKNISPDLVILDRDLPSMTGSEILGKIRDISGTVPVIILTGYDSPEDAKKYIEMGATLFISKAEGLSRVLDEVEGILGEPETVSPKAPAGTSFSKKTDAEGKPKILVADDDIQMRNMLCRYLASLGYKTICAVDGRDAILKFDSEKPDITLLDIYMPGLNGVQVLEHISANYPGRGVIMITGNDEEEIARECLQKGAVDYISKPVNLKMLETALKARLAIQGF